VSIPLTPERLAQYCGARSVAVDLVRSRVRCTLCSAEWPYTPVVDWFRCAHGCGDFLDAYEECAKAARMLNAHRPLSAEAAALRASAVEVTQESREAATVTPPVAPVIVAPLRALGRPSGSASVTAEQIAGSFAAIAAPGRRRPTRDAVARDLAVSVDTIDRVLARAGMRFSQLR
jgi:hypothetical protein